MEPAGLSDPGLSWRELSLQSRREGRTAAGLRLAQGSGVTRARRGTQVRRRARGYAGAERLDGSGGSLSPWDLTPDMPDTWQQGRGQGELVIVDRFLSGHLTLTLIPFSCLHLTGFDWVRMFPIRLNELNRREGRRADPDAVPIVTSLSLANKQFRHRSVPKINPLRLSIWGDTIVWRIPESHWQSPWETSPTASTSTPHL